MTPRRRGVVLLVAGVLIAVLGNAWQGRSAAGVRGEAVATGRLGTPLAVTRAGEELRIFLDRSAGTVAVRDVEGRVRCTGPGVTGPERGRRVTKLDQYTQVGGVSAGSGSITIRCTPPDVPGATGLPLVVTRGGASTTPAVIVLVAGILVALYGAALVLAALIPRCGARAARRR